LQYAKAVHEKAKAKRDVAVAVADNDSKAHKVAEARLHAANEDVKRKKELRDKADENEEIVSQARVDAEKAKKGDGAGKDDLQSETTKLTEKIKEEEEAQAEIASLKAKLETDKSQNAHVALVTKEEKELEQAMQKEHELKQELEELKGVVEKKIKDVEAKTEVHEKGGDVKGVIARLVKRGRAEKALKS